jgi:hypothetical protein
LFERGEGLVKMRVFHVIRVSKTLPSASFIGTRVAGNTRPVIVSLALLTWPVMSTVARDVCASFTEKKTSLGFVRIPGMVLVKGNTT